MSISLKAKLYGESYWIHRLHIDTDNFIRFQEIAMEMGEPLEDALLNINFFRYLKNTKIQSVNDFKQSSFGGLIKNSKSQVEIWMGRRRVLKLGLDNLFHQQTLFPLYHTQFNRIKTNLKPGLYLEEKEIGNIGIFEIKTDTFKIDDLNFQLSEIAFTGLGYHLLTEINYKEHNLQLLKSDTLLQYQRCFFQK